MSDNRSGARKRAVLACTLVGVCLIALPGLRLGAGGRQVHGHLVRAASLVEQLQAQLAAGDTAGGRDTLNRLQRETTRASAITGGPLWRVAGHLPAVGDDLDAIAVVASTVSELADTALPALVETVEAVEPARLMPVDGQLDVDTIGAIAPRLATADAAIQRARRQVARISTDALAGEIRSGVVALTRVLDKTAAMTGPAARFAALLPPMLGANQPRRYLVLVQNPAEVRATGGMPGAYLVLGVHRGRLSIEDQGTASAGIGVFAEPVLPLEPGLLALYTDKLGKYPANVNLTPHFPTAARLARRMYELRSGHPVDGVLATDPVALSYLLRATGPVSLPVGPPLTAAHVVRTLLVDTYASNGGNAEHDRFFATAAAAVFHALTRRPAKPQAMLVELGRAASERRLLLWSADPAEQAVIERTALSGTLPVDDGAKPTIGVFLNDGTGAKLSYYLAPAAELTIVGCRPDGRREYRLRVTLRSTAPKSGLSQYVLGGALAGDPYTVRTNVSVFAPTGGGVVAAWLDGTPAPIGTGVENARAVGIVTVDVPPASERHLEVTVLSGVPPTGRAHSMPELRTTPVVAHWKINIHSVRICSR